MTDEPAVPDLAIVIPAHNEAILIRRALNSILAQRWPIARIEAVVVANACSDETAQQVRGFMADHPKLTLKLIEVAELGVSNARNVGAKAARAQLVLFLDADSVMTPYVVARAVRMSRDGIDVATYRMLADSGDRLDQLFYWLIELIMTVRRVRSFNFFCRRDLFLAHGGLDPSISLAEVMDLFTRFKASGISVEHTSTVIRTSPRRLHTRPLRIGWLTTFIRWSFAGWGYGRRAPYRAVAARAEEGR